MHLQDVDESKMGRYHKLKMKIINPLYITAARIPRTIHHHPIAQHTLLLQFSFSCLSYLFKCQGVTIKYFLRTM